MTAITYTAKRNLASGHTIDSSYDLETASEQIDIQREEIGSEGKALDGTTESSLDRIDRGYSILTGYIEASDMPLWDEFIDSVAVAESFTFDAYGTIASPVNPQTVVMERGSSNWSRVGSIMTFQLRFRVRVL